MRAFLILNSCVSLAALGWCAKLHSDSERLFTAAKMTAAMIKKDREVGMQMKAEIGLAAVGSAKTANALEDVEMSLLHLSALLVDQGITWTPPLSK